MHQVFDPDNAWWRFVSRCVDIVGLSVFWAILCLPVVTVGPVTSALYYTVVKCFRQGEKGTFGVFYRAFRENLKQGAFATLICLPFAAALAFGYAVMRANWSSDAGAVMFVAYDVALVVPAGVVCWLFPLLGRFSLRLRDAFRTAAALALRHLPSTVVVVLLTLELGVFTLDRRWPVFFAPVLCALLTSLFFERVFPKYLSEEDAEKLEDTSETPIE
ncbi:MAG: YesL family protein [Oscillospiraceae bacterium]|nr:YesL family protein [Oscillospiraceae bacterium]